MTIKKITVLVLFLSFCFLHSSYSQKYSDIDRAVVKYPKYFNSTEDLAQKIKEDFSSDGDKALLQYVLVLSALKHN